MREIEIPVREAPSLRINGEDYPLLLGDAEIFDRALRIAAKYRGIGGGAAPRKVLRAVRESAALLEEILGAGALRRINGGAAVAMADTLRICAQVVEAAAQAYARRLDEYV